MKEELIHSESLGFSCRVAEIFIEKLPFSTNRCSKETQMMLLRKYTVAMSIPHTILWKKLYVLKLEWQNTRNSDQKRTLICELHSVSFSGK